MKTEVKVYNIKEFVRKNVSGELDLEKSFALTRQVSDISLAFPNRNILVDMRGTELKDISFNDLMKITVELLKSISNHEVKIASVIPDDEGRINTAKTFQTFLELKQFTFEFFTDFEKAFDWLSDSPKSHDIIFKKT